MSATNGFDHPGDTQPPADPLATVEMTASLSTAGPAPVREDQHPSKPAAAAAAAAAGDDDPAPAAAASPKRAPMTPFVQIGDDDPWGINQDFTFEMLERKDLGKLEELGGIEGLAKRLAAHTEDGVLSETTEARRRVFGINELMKKDPVTFFEFLKEAFSDKIILILCVCAVISIIFGMTLPDPHSGKVDRGHGWIEGTAIVISILIVVLVGSINNYRKAKKFEEMEAEEAIQDVQVFRDGKEITIRSNMIVVGDVLIIENGVKLSCDGILIHGSDLKVDESAMTGEPDMIKKSREKDPFFLSGTQITDGNGRILVISVGMRSYQGKMKAAVSEESAETPLQMHLADLADDVGKLGLIGAIVLVVALYIKEGVQIADGKEATATAFLNYLILAITVIVVAIPEGLPLAVTIALAFSMKAMMDDHCLVRVLASCETMGAATAVCSDKTGTLTTNVMSVVQGCVLEEEFVIGGYGLVPRQENVLVFDRATPTLTVDAELMVRAIALNTTARQQEIDGRLQWVGNKTEHGLLGFANLLKMDYMAMRASVPESAKKQFPFNSTKKRMTTIARESDGGLIAYVKGASEVILEACDRYLDRTGNVQPMTAEKRAFFTAVITDIADQGNRTIGVAYAPFTAVAASALATLEEEPDVERLIFVGVLGIQDPIRVEVPDAVLSCAAAHITVRMVTGDNINTAIAIAKKCHIYEENGWDRAMLGQDFRRMFNEDKPALMELLPRLRVLARSSPQDKHILVGCLQELGEVVGVTGDGTNDAPALKLANVGFAMHIGTDIAKGAADMVLLDNNFASVVNAVRWGRSVNDNIRKFLQFQLTINVGGVLLTVIGSLASPTSKGPFTPVQLLWLNMIMDTLAALALATEKPDDSCLKRLPVFKQAPLVSNRMRAFILGHAAYQVGIIFMHIFSSHEWLDIGIKGCENLPPKSGGTYSPLYLACERSCKEQGGVFVDDQYCQQGNVHSTVIFNTFIWMQIGNVFNARLLHGGQFNPFGGLLSRSLPLLLIMFVVGGFQAFAVEVAGPFMQTTSLDWQLWLICIAFGLSEWIVGFVVRAIPVEDEIPEEVRAKWAKEQHQREALGLRPAAGDRSSVRGEGSAHGGHGLSLVRGDPVARRFSVRKGNAWQH